MKHAREDYNGRVVDLCEPRVVAAINDAVMVLQRLMNPLPATAPTQEQVQAAHDGLAGLYAFHEGSDFGAIRPIPDEEPVFLLRGQDATASYVVDHWASKNVVRADHDAGLVASARAHADRMREWPVQKTADA